MLCEHYVLTIFHKFRVNMYDSCLIIVIRVKYYVVKKFLQTNCLHSKQ